MLLPYRSVKKRGKFSEHSHYSSPLPQSNITHREANENFQRKPSPIFGLMTYIAGITASDGRVALQCESLLAALDGKQHEYIKKYPELRSGLPTLTLTRGIEQTCSMFRWLPSIPQLQRAQLVSNLLKLAIKDVQANCEQKTLESLVMNTVSDCFELAHNEDPVSGKKEEFVFEIKAAKTIATLDAEIAIARAMMPSNNGDWVAKRRGHLASCTM